MESERARNTSFEPSTECYQTVEFDLALTDTVLTRWVAVSYTHLDVYKRQNQYSAPSATFIMLVKLV